MWKKYLKTEVKEDDIKIRPEEAYVIASLETNAGNARGWAYYYAGDFQETVESIEKLEKALKIYQEMERGASEEELSRMKRQAGDIVQGLVPSDSKRPAEIIQRHLEHFRNKIKQSQEGSASQFAQAAEHTETIRHVQSAETYALREAYDSYAQAAIKAMRQTEKIEREGILKVLKARKHYEKPSEIKRRKARTSKNRRKNL